MSHLSLVFLALFAAEPASQADSSSASPATKPRPYTEFLASLRGFRGGDSSLLLRGQTPGTYDGLPASGPLGGTSGGVGTTSVTPVPDSFNPFGSQSTFVAPPGFVPPGYVQDPFLGGGGYPAGFSNVPLDGTMAFGIVGPQPYRFGWTTRFDTGYAPATNANAGGAGIGKFGILEANLASRFTAGMPSQFPSFIFSWTPEFNYRGWSGPDTIPLPANVFRFASDIELATPGNEPVSFQFGFTPSVNTDFGGAALTRDAINFDGRGVMFWRVTPDTMIAIGAFYWDRVDQIILPYAGVVFTPDDRWELRLLFPKSRISYFLGNDIFGSAVWIYGGVEYNVEAYQVSIPSPGRHHDRIQVADYRAMLGFRSDNGLVATFVEAGYIFARDVKFKHGAGANFDVDNGLFGRLGIRF